MSKLLSHLTAIEVVAENWGRASAIGGMVVLSMVDRLPPVQRRYEVELEMRGYAFAAGRAYERELLGLPPVRSCAETSRAPGVAALGHPAAGARRRPARVRHLHLV